MVDLVIFFVVFWGAKFQTLKFFFNPLPKNYDFSVVPPEKKTKLDCKNENQSQESDLMMNPLSKNCVYLVVIIHYGKKRRKYL